MIITSIDDFLSQNNDSFYNIYNIIFINYESSFIWNKKYFPLLYHISCFSHIFVFFLAVTYCKWFWNRGIIFWSQDDVEMKCANPRISLFDAAWRRIQFHMHLSQCKIWIADKLYLYFRWGIITEKIQW